MRRRYDYSSNGWWDRKQLYECNMRSKNKNFTIGQTWEALKKCWRGYEIAKNKLDFDNMLKYAARIQKLQWELDVPKCAFPNLGLDNL